jgi:hypothetical protein
MAESEMDHRSISTLVSSRSYRPALSAEDRRHSARFSTALDVEYGMGQDFVHGKIVNVGLSGFGIIGENTYPVGSKVELLVRAPESGDKLRINAIVCFSNHNKMGVQVITVPREGAKILEAIYELSRIGSR